MNARALGHEGRTILRFFVEAVGAVAILAAAKIATRMIPAVPGSTAYILVQLLPVPAVWLLPLVMLRHYRRIDELQRLMFLQSIALTFGILVGVAWSWPSLHQAFGWVPADNGMWEVYFSIVFVVISALLTRMRAAPRAR
jgi:hypothetical protein